MRFKAWRSLSDGYRKAVEGHSPWPPDTRNPAPILVSDVSTDPSLGPLREAILAEGIHSLGFIPLGHHGQLLGKFMVYYDKPHAFSDVDLKIAAMVAHYVAFGLDRVRAQAAIEGLLERERTARREAESANRAKDDFLAMLSHELRNPLNASSPRSGFWISEAAARTRARSRPRTSFVVRRSTSLDCWTICWTRRRSAADTWRYGPSSSICGRWSAWRWSICRAGSAPRAR